MLSGEDEARLTFLAVRRWFGWSAGTCSSSTSAAARSSSPQGIDEDPDVAVSLPLGAGRLTRDLLPGDPPATSWCAQARKQVRASIAAELRPLARPAPRPRGRHLEDDALAGPDLRRGAERRGHVRRPRPDRHALSARLPEIAAMTAAERADLPGVSASRSRQLLAGALVAEATMDLLGLDQLEICPWALREGIILRHLDRMS